MKNRNASSVLLHPAPKATPRPASRPGKLLSTCVFALSMIASCARMHAQTLGLQFHAGSLTQINSGFSGTTTYFLGVAVDSSGNVYVADNYSATVYKETLSNGTYTKSVVMSGLTNYLGYLAVDKLGNVYIADQLGGPAHPGIGYKGIVYKATPSGTGYTTTTVTGTIPNPYGIAVDASGDIFISTYGQPAANGVAAIPPSVYKEAPSGSSYVETAIVSAGLSNPQGVAVDGSGNLYIDDIQANHILKETPGSGTYTTTATITAVAVNSAYGCLAVDAAGNLYVCAVGPTYVNTYSQLIYKLTLSDGPYGGNYFATPVGDFTSLPEGVAVDANQNVYMTNGSLFVASTPTANFGSVALGATSSVISVPFTTDEGSVGYISAAPPITEGDAGKDFTDAGTGTCNTNGLTHTYIWGETCTVDIKFKPSVAGTRNGAVQLLNSQGTPLATAYITGNGSGPQIAYGTRVQTTAISTGLKAPQGVAVDANGNLFIADTGNARVLLETLSGSTYTQSLVSQFGLKNIAYKPTGIALDPAGLVYIGDGGNSRAAEFYFDFTAYVPQQIFTGIGYAQGVATDTAGNLYVADSTNNVIWEAQTLYSDIWNSVPGVTVVSTLPLTGLNAPTGIAEDGSGNLYITDTGNNRVLKETPVAGSLLTSNVYSYTQTVIGSGLSAPAGVAVDGLGNVFISDTGNNRVLEETLSAGNYTQSVVVTGLSGPTGLTVDGLGTIYVADTGNNRILKFGVGAIPSLSFASTAVGSTSIDSPQTVTIQNVGNATLTLPIPTSGNDPSITANFTFSSTGSTACPLIGSTASNSGTLAPGASCTLPISFTPTTTGSLAGTLTLTDNNLNVAASSQVIPLSGTGAVAATAGASLTPSPVAFANQTVLTTSSAMTVTLTNLTTSTITGIVPSITGTNSGDFAINVAGTTCTTTLAGSATCNIAVTFTPATPTGFSATLSISDTATGSPQTASLAGTGIPVVPTATLLPTPVGFGYVSINSSVTHTLTLTNTGTVAFPISSASLASQTGTAANYSVYGTTCNSSLAINSSCTYTIEYEPTVTGSSSIVFSVTDTADSITLTASLSGTGASPSGTLLPTPANLGNVTVNSTATQVLTLTNTGTVAFPINATALQSQSGGAATYSVAGTTCGTSLATSGSCTYTINYKPTATGNSSISFVVFDTVDPLTLTASLSGTGVTVAPTATLLPTPVSFGNVSLNSTVKQILTLTNTGTVAFPVSSTSLASQTGTAASYFVYGTTCNSSLATSSSCTYTIAYEPTAIGISSITFSVTDTTDSITLTASLSGTGASPSATLLPTPVNFGSVTVNTAATQVLTLTNTGTVAFSINSTGIQSQSGTAATYSVASTTCGTSLATSSSCTYTISYTPTATGGSSISFVVFDTVDPLTLTASLSGTGTAASIADFSIAATQPPAVQPGSSVQIPLTISSVSGIFTNVVTFGVTGLPAGSTAIFTPSSVTLGSSGASSILTIQTSVPVGRLVAPGRGLRTFPSLALLIGLPLLGMRRLRRRLSSAGKLLLLAVLSLIASAPLTGCGGGLFNPTPQSYNLTITGTSGSLQHSTTVVLTIL